MILIGHVLAEVVRYLEQQPLFAVLAQAKVEPVLNSGDAQVFGQLEGEAVCRHRWRLLHLVFWEQGVKAVLFGLRPAHAVREAVQVMFVLGMVFLMQVVVLVTFGLAMIVAAIEGLPVKFVLVTKAMQDSRFGEDLAKRTARI